MVIEGEAYAQALSTLDRRWMDGGTAVDVGEEAHALYSSEWPKELTPEAYDEHFNKVVALAGSVGLSPLCETEGGKLLRKGWWHIISSPPVDSLFYPAAEEARVVTSGECSTVEHRVQYRMAMMEAITRKMSSWSTGKVGALVGGVLLEKAKSSKVYQCAKCPLRDGSRTMHVGEAKCGAVVICEVCNSDRHAAHSCYIAHGVPVDARI